MDDLKFICQGKDVEVCQLPPDQFQLLYDKFCAANEPAYQLAVLRTFDLTYQIIPSFELPAEVTITYVNNQWLATAKIGAADPLITPLSEDWAQCFFDRLRKTKICPCPLGEDGCDGVLYQLTLRMGFTEYSFKWWISIPDELNELAPLITEIEMQFLTSR